jgi:Tol biopolymer transport system component
MLLLLLVAGCKSHDKITNPGLALLLPPGYSLAFRSTRDGNPEIYRVDPDTIIRLTHNTFVDQDPAWSHDGSKIAFVSTRDGNREIYVMNADSTGVTRLTNNPANDTHPAWSPGDTAIAFASNRDGNGEIYVMTPTAAIRGISRMTPERTTGRAGLRRGTRSRFSPTATTSGRSTP